MVSGERADRAGQQGFTLIELMVVVVIISIMASFALPKYQKVVERSRQGEAYLILGTLRDAEFRYRAEEGVYTNQLNVLGIDDPNTLPNIYFDYAIEDASNETFTTRATRNSYRRLPEVPVYSVTLDQDGNLVRGY
ncbi:MAG: prepilin-type N-terminal cleavage/methylation domain-containing protein [Candidatus Omnitrophica bacterium]|nr:prepilin-type N-terminal cleavage/methylation domain-containing protein [Candidatus Omnitrophota bacterium]